jgi:hypothetical protein
MPEQRRPRCFFPLGGGYLGARLAGESLSPLIRRYVRTDQIALCSGSERAGAPLVRGKGISHPVLIDAIWPLLPAWLSGPRQQRKEGT